MNSAAAISNRLTEITRKLAEASVEYTEACKTPAEARTTYDLQKARAMLDSKRKTAGERLA